MVRPKSQSFDPFLGSLWETCVNLKIWGLSVSAPFTEKKNVTQRPKISHNLRKISTILDKRCNFLPKCSTPASFDIFLFTLDVPINQLLLNNHVQYPFPHSTTVNTKGVETFPPAGGSALNSPSMPEKNGIN